VERGSAEPQEYRVITRQAREAARQLFVIRHYQWLSGGFAGLCDKFLSYLRSTPGFTLPPAIEG